MAIFQQKMTMPDCPANLPQTSVMKNYRHAPETGRNLPGKK
jgi:hypothetical protein